MMGQLLQLGAKYGPTALQAAPGIGQVLGGLFGLKSGNPLAGLENLNTSQFKMPGQDDLYKSISKAYDSIAPQFLNATGAQQDSINQSKSDAARNIAASMGRGVGSAVGGRLAGEANAASTQMRAQMEAQRAGAAQSQGQAGHTANVNQVLQKIQAHVQDVTSANQNLLAQSEAPDPMAAIFQGLGAIGGEINAYQNRDVSNPLSGLNTEGASDFFASFKKTDGSIDLDGLFQYINSLQGQARQLTGTR